MPAKSLRRKMRHGDVQKPREKFSPISVTFTNIFKVQKKRDSDVNDRHLLLLRSGLHKFCVKCMRGMKKDLGLLSRHLGI